VVLVDLDRPHTTPVADPVSNLVYAATGNDVHTVLVDGQVVLRARQATTMDEAEIIASARASSARVVGAITPPHHPRWPLH
jgi:5-methylthioadenosine/S-adenosylhomocysteine deaminase